MVVLLQRWVKIAFQQLRDTRVLSMKQSEFRDALEVQQQFKTTQRIILITSRDQGRRKRSLILKQRVELRKWLSVGRIAVFQESQHCVQCSVQGSEVGQERFVILKPTSLKTSQPRNLTVLKPYNLAHHSLHIFSMFPPNHYIIQPFSILDIRHNIMIITPHQNHRNCLNFLTHIYGSQHYEIFRSYLLQYREQNKSAVGAIAAFVKIARFLATIENDPHNLIDELNKCLLKEIVVDGEKDSQKQGRESIQRENFNLKDNSLLRDNPSLKDPKSTLISQIPPSSTSFEGISLQKLKQLALTNPNSLSILDTVSSWLKTDSSPSVPRTPIIQQLTEHQFQQRFQFHPSSQQIAKLLYLYRRCIISLKQLKAILNPIYLTDASLFNMLFQYAQEMESKRRRGAIFVSLNELVDGKYPMNQVGNSYVSIPDGYANYSHCWRDNALESVMNREIVSVPLGSEVSFIIMRKNQYEEQLFNNQEEKYQLDSNLNCLRAAIKIVEEQLISKPSNSALLQRVLSYIYPSENVFRIVINNPEIAKNVVLPRLKQKQAELTKCRKKFEKTCQDFAVKNFYKSLDYRCFYFCKNDKKFNCPSRWQNEVYMRKKQILHDLQPLPEHQIEDRQSLQRTRNYIFNSFDNITKQQFIENRKIEFNFQKKQNVEYPIYPNNQILFVMEFGNQSVLNDALEIILFHTQKKAILELMVMKMLRKNIERVIPKDNTSLRELQESSNGFNNGNIPPFQPLNEQRCTKKAYKDVNEEFYDLIEEEIEPLHIEQVDFPFQGPTEHTFIGSKQCYFFLRYLVTIYQRFLKAKQLAMRSGGTSSTGNPQIYRQFLSILTYKLKEQRNFEEYLRKAFQQQAFIFFTLDKLIGGITKLINNISTDSLTYKILKDNVKDYDLQIKKWADYTHPSVTEQLVRLYREGQMLFRFSLQDKLCYVSGWDNTGKKQGKSIYRYMTDANDKTHDKWEGWKREDEHWYGEEGELVSKGEFICVRKRKRSDSMELEKEIKRIKRIKINQ